MNPQANRFLTAVGKSPRAALALLILLLVTCLLGSFMAAKQIALERLEAQMDLSQLFEEHQLEQLIETTLLLPRLVAASHALPVLLSRPDPVAVREQNEILDSLARAAKVDVIYVMDHRGNTIAASNWRMPDSFVGRNYEFRPYFQQALAGETGRYLARGVTSNKLGVYLAHPVMADGGVQGVIVVKISFESIQAHVEALWRRTGRLVLVADEHGVIAVSPVTALTFQAIQEIPADTHRKIEASRQYGDRITVVPMLRDDADRENLRFVRFQDIPRQSFVQKSYPLPELGMRLVVHEPASAYRETVAKFTAMFAVATILVFLVGLMLYQRLAYGAKLVEAAVHDPLTGLSTRLYMNVWCEAAIRSHDRDPRAGMALVMFDLDRFKHVNDVYGHLAGDEVLRLVGEMIRGAIRGDDLAVRFGGEELAVFVRCANHAEAVALAERIRASVESHDFQSRKGRIPVTISAGVAFHEVGEALDGFFARADAKLYEAKEGGRNRVCG